MSVESPTLTRRVAIGSWRADLAAALPGWIIARIVVLVSLATVAVVQRIVGSAGVNPSARGGLLGWDADWYRRIAVDGYQHLPLESLRFFPLLPIVVRVLVGHAWWAVGVMLLLLANSAALLAGALLHRFCLEHGSTPAQARRAPLYFALLPPAFVLVMGYTEALAISLALVFLLAISAERWALATAAGLLAGLARPTGALLVIPAAIMCYAVLRGRRSDEPRQPLARVLAVAAPLSGAALYLGWCQLVLGRWSLPFSVQTVPELRGSLTNPISSVLTAGWSLATGRFVDGGHEITVLLALVVFVIGLRRWPASLNVWLGATLLVALTAQSFGSLERYLWSAIVPVMTLATFVPERMHRWAIVASTVGLACFSGLAFAGLYVP
jgi:hypothetical protein